MEKVLVAGANGTTGKEIMNILRDHPQYEPVAMLRKEEQRAAFDLQNVKSVIADLEGDLTEAVKGIDRVIFAAGSGGKNTIDVDQNGAINLIDSSKAAGIKKLVMLSAMGTENPTAIPELEQYFHAKKNADDHLKASFLEYSIVKPGRLTNGEKTNKIKAKKRLNESGEISRKDVAQVLVNCLPPSILQNKEVEIVEGETAIAIALGEIGR